MNFYININELLVEFDWDKKLKEEVFKYPRNNNFIKLP